MTTTIGTQLRPYSQDYGTRSWDDYRVNPHEHNEEENDDVCNWNGCENASTHWAYCHPDGHGCGQSTPWCIDHVLNTVSKKQTDPSYMVKHGSHMVLARFITYTPKK